MKQQIKDKLFEFEDRFLQSDMLEKIILIAGSLYFGGHIIVAIAKAKGWI